MVSASVLTGACFAPTVMRTVLVELSTGDGCSCRTDAPHEVENPDPSAEALIYLIVERG
jgi:hypothetical protein